MAFADKALFGYDCYSDLLEQEIPEGRESVQLRWTDETAELPILRHIEADGTVTTEPMKRQTFERIFNAAVANEGYATPGGIHKVRRTLGKKLDGESRLAFFSDSGLVHQN